MKKTLIALTLTLAAATAGASELRQLAQKSCATIANAGTIAARGATIGRDWNDIYDRYNSLDDGPVKRLLMGVLTDSYFAWSTLEPQLVRTLGYNKCMAEAPEAFGFAR